MAEAAKILHDPDRYVNKAPARGTVTHALLWMARIFMAIDAVAATYAAFITFG